MSTSRPLNSTAIPPPSVGADPDQLLDEAAVSTWVGRPKGWFAKARMSGAGPRFVKIGRKIAYRRGAVLEWLRENERKSTAETNKAL